MIHIKRSHTGKRERSTMDSLLKGLLQQHLLKKVSVKLHWREMKALPSNLQIKLIKDLVVTQLDSLRMEDRIKGKEVRDLGRTWTSRILTKCWKNLSHSQRRDLEMDSLARWIDLKVISSSTNLYFLDQGATLPQPMQRP